jgi:general L-amino acid transport system permease protein
MESPVYVRSAMLPAQKPPSSQVGAVRWVRENLFSGPLNTILTLASIYVVYLIAGVIGPWLTRSVWNASSLAECRSIIEAAYGPGKTGACFAVVVERWQQIIFGFYPRDLYWRPTLTLILMLVALAPVLFSGLPRKMLWFSFAFPAVAFWLLWGGSVWLPVTILLGFGVAYAAFRLLSPVNGLLGIIAAFVAPVLYWLFLCGPLEQAIHAVLPLGLHQLASDDFGGFLLSTVIGVSGIAFSLPIGILLALGRQSDLFIVRTACIAFIEGFRGVPLITLLFVASLLLNYFLPPGTEFDIILRVIIMVTIFSAAYMAEVIRGGLAALPRGQYEAADALGLDYWQAQRLIVMPQALKVSIPGIVGNFIGLFKDTTLVSFISLQDPLQLVSSIRANTEWNGIYWELFIFVGFLFFIFCFGMSRYSMYLERRLKTDHR